MIGYETNLVTCKTGVGNEPVLANNHARTAQSQGLQDRRTKSLEPVAYDHANHAESPLLVV